MDVSTLITLVQQYNELYNLGNPNYMNQPRRDNIWDEIGDQLGQTGAACRERWQRIRENFRRAIHIRKTKSGQAVDKLKPPKYFKELSFLIPYLNDEENRQSNIPRPGSNSHSTSFQSPINSLEDEENRRFNITRPGNNSYSTSSRSPINYPEEGDSLLPDFSPPTLTPTPKRRQFTPTYTSSSSSCLPDQSNTAASVLKEYLASTKMQATSNSAPHTDHITDFFLTMAKTVKNFSLDQQLKIKAGLFQMVHNIELEIMNEAMLRSINETNASQPIEVPQHYPSSHTSHTRTIVSNLQQPNHNIPTESYTVVSSTSPTPDVLLQPPDNTQIVNQSSQILQLSSHTSHRLNSSRAVGHSQQPNHNIPTESYTDVPSTSPTSDVLLQPPDKTQIVNQSSQILQLSSHTSNRLNSSRAVGNWQQPNYNIPTESYTVVPSTSPTSDVLLQPPDKTQNVNQSSQILQPSSHTSHRLNSSRAVGNWQQPNYNIPTESYTVVPSTSPTSDVLLQTPDKTQIVNQSSQILQLSSHTSNRLNSSRAVGNLQQPNYNIPTESYTVVPSTSPTSDVLLQPPDKTQNVNQSSQILQPSSHTSHRLNSSRAVGNWQQPNYNIPTESYTVVPSTSPTSDVLLQPPDKTQNVNQSSQILQPSSHTSHRLNSSRAVGNWQQPNYNIPTESYTVVPSTSPTSDVLLQTPDKTQIVNQSSQILQLSSHTSNRLNSSRAVGNLQQPNYNIPTESYTVVPSTSTSDVLLQSPDKTRIVIRSSQILQPSSHTSHTLNSSCAVGTLQQPNYNISTESYTVVPSTSPTSDVLLQAPDQTRIIIRSSQILQPSSRTLHTLNSSHAVGNLQRPNYNTRTPTGSYQAKLSRSHSSDVLISSAQQCAADESQVINLHDTNEEIDDTLLPYKLSDYVLLSKKN